MVTITDFRNYALAESVKNTSFPSRIIYSICYKRQWNNYNELRHYLSFKLNYYAKILKVANFDSADACFNVYLNLWNYLNGGENK